MFSSGRVKVITFDRHFDESEQDKGLKDRFRRPENASGILNWMLQGLQEYYRIGLCPPEAVVNASDQYRRDSDKMGAFILDCMIEKVGGVSSAKEAYDRYSVWCSDNGFHCENKRNFFQVLKRKGIFKDSGTIAGKTVRNVISGYVLDDSQIKNQITSDNPFVE